MPVATDAFRCTEAYSVPIVTLDAQHQELLAAISELNEALRSASAMVR